MCKEGFYFFTNYRNIAKDLPVELRAEFYEALMDYAIDGIEPENGIIKALITAIKPSLDKTEKRGGNHNPTGQNQYKEVKVGQSEVKSGQNEVKVGQSGQTFNKQETRNINILTPLDNKLSISPYRGNELCSCDCKRTAKFEINGKKFCGQHTRIELTKLGRLDLMPKKEKLTFDDVLDWDSLFQYWEENKKGGMYKTHESRTRMLDKLKELTNNDFNLAKLSICHAIDNKYQGFCNGGELFYKPPKGGFKTAEQEQRERELIDKYWGDDDAEI